MTVNLRSVYLSSLAAAVRSAIDPGLAILPVKLDTPAARVQLAAIGLQESRLQFRFQKTNDPYVKGPARGLWQFERGGGVRGVMAHRASEKLARMVCEQRGVRFSESDVHARLEFDDVLACCFARLLLLTDPAPLPDPAAADPEVSWDYYIRNWRPGKPHRATWNEFLSVAREGILGIEA